MFGDIRSLCVFRGMAPAVPLFYFIGGQNMETYKEMYYKLFNSVTDAISQLMRLETVNAIHTLMDAQQATEDIFIEAGTD